MDGASKATLENEFGTKNEEDAIIQILEKGDIQNVEVCWPMPRETSAVLTRIYRTLLEEETVTTPREEDKRIRSTPDTDLHHSSAPPAKILTVTYLQTLSRSGHNPGAQQAQRPQ